MIRLFSVCRVSHTDITCRWIPSTVRGRSSWGPCTSGHVARRGVVTHASAIEPQVPSS